MIRVALFGTSADPPTRGHQIILEWLARTFDEVAVWAADNPFKRHQAPLDHRETMLRLLIDAITPRPSHLHLYPELSNPRTIYTVERARTLWPMAEFTLVIGSDLLPQFPKWYAVDQLLAQVQVLVVPRAGYPLHDTDVQTLRLRGAQVAIASLNGPAVSSSAYREQRDLDAIPPSIQDYIHREQLYLCRDLAQSKL